MHLKKPRLKLKIFLIVFIKGPGLLGSLLVGNLFAKSMSLGLNIPLIDASYESSYTCSFYSNFTMKRS